MPHKLYKENVYYKEKAMDHGEVILEVANLSAEDLDFRGAQNATTLQGNRHLTNTAAQYAYITRG